MKKVLTIRQAITRAIEKLEERNKELSRLNVYHATLTVLQLDRGTTYISKITETQIKKELTKLKFYK